MPEWGFKTIETMKKLDEIMELMTDEMADFKTAILKLQLLSKQLGDLSIPISTEALENKLNIFLQNQEAKNEVQQDMLKSIGKKLKHARLLPNYIFYLFGILGTLALGLLGYFGYAAKAAKQEQFEVYRMMQSQQSRYQEYFSENPKIKDDYCQWLETKNQDL